MEYPLLSTFCGSRSLTFSDNDDIRNLLVTNTLLDSVLGNGGAINFSTDAIYTSSVFNIAASFPGLCADTLTTSTIANIGDIEPPIINCRTDTVIYIQNGDCNPILSIDAPVETSDNCGIESVIYSLTGDTNLSSPLTGINNASGEIYNISKIKL